MVHQSTIPRGVFVGAIHEEIETDLNLMMDSKLKIPYAYQVMIVYRLVICLWRKQLVKESDLLVYLPFLSEGTRSDHGHLDETRCAG